MSLLTLDTQQLCVWICDETLTSDQQNAVERFDAVLDLIEAYLKHLLLYHNGLCSENPLLFSLVVKLFRLPVFFNQGCRLLQCLMAFDCERNCGVWFNHLPASAEVVGPFFFFFFFFFAPIVRFSIVFLDYLFISSCFL